ncbi:MAG: hypothetical protein AAFX85_02145, partial [Pseudomonadota bacterium]
MLAIRSPTLVLSMMTAYTATPTAARRMGSQPFLKGAVLYWFALAVFGQWLFTYYLFRAFAVPYAVGDTQSLQAMQMIT